MSVGLIIVILLWSVSLFSIVIFGKYSGIPGVLASIFTTLVLTVLLLLWPRYAFKGEDTDENEDTTVDEMAWLRIILLIILTVAIFLAVARTLHQRLLAEFESPIRVTRSHDHFFTLTN
uniref:Transmembrane protein n=1 Tax=Steinernema glaseri TaxID=37863 RepID=A0A1I7Z3C7_9BILA